MDRTLADTIAGAREYLHPNDLDCVVYHNPCNDGSGAAVAAWLELGDKVSYIPRSYHQTFSKESLRGKNAVVLDASFTRDELIELRQIAKKLMIIDHHDSAMRDLGDLPGCFFTMDNSGAVLSWHYFHGIDTPAPKFLILIEDRDLWRWKYRDLSEPLYYALKERCPNSDFKHFVLYVDPEKLSELLAYGKTLVAGNHKWCEEAAKGAVEKTFKLPNSTEKYTIMCSELENDRLVSELSEHLYILHPHIDFVMLWCKVSANQFKISFRSEVSHVNLGAIATELGGGGHKQAAGVVVNFSPWDLTA